MSYRAPVQDLLFAMQHLAKLGHTRIGILTDASESSDVRDRVGAYRDFCKAKGWPVVERRLLHHPAYSVRGPDEDHVYRYFFDADEPPTALLALGSTRWRTPFCSFASILSLSTVSGMRNRRR